MPSLGIAFCFCSAILAACSMACVSRDTFRYSALKINLEPPSMIVSSWIMSPESDDAQRVTRLIKKIGGWLVMISSLRLCVDAPRKPRLIAGWAASIQPRGGEPQCQGMRSRRQHGYNPPRRAASDELKRYPFLSTTSVLRICQTEYRQNGIALSRPPISVRPNQPALASKHLAGL